MGALNIKLVIVAMELMERTRELKDREIYGRVAIVVSSPQITRISEGRARVK